MKKVVRVIVILLAAVIAVSFSAYAEEKDTFELAFANGKRGVDALANVIVPEGRGIGVIYSIAQTREGTLLTGMTEFSGEWAVFLDPNGQERWSLEGLYRQPAALPNGGFAMLRENADESLSVVAVNNAGRVITDYAVSRYTSGFVTAGERVFMLGNQWMRDDINGDGYAGPPFLHGLDNEAGLLWSCTYPHDFARLTFGKAVFAMDYLFVCANAQDDEGLNVLGRLYRLDMDGNSDLYVEFTSDLGDECEITDVCVNEDGLIAVIVAEYGYNEDYGFNIDRLCHVMALDIDGGVLWTYTFNDGESRFERIVQDGVMAKQILPVRGGFLCAGYKIASEDSGFLNIEWLCLLDKEGNMKAIGTTPDIKSDSIIWAGMASGANGQALLYGVNIEELAVQADWEEGDYQGIPFFAEVDFPEAYAVASRLALSGTYEQLVAQIDELLTLSKEEIIDKLGPDYVVEPVGPEGALDGYYYKDLGMAFAFYPDSTVPDIIECYEGFHLYGIGIGNRLSEVTEALGDSGVNETWLMGPEDKAYMLSYQFGNAMYSFIAFEEDGPVYILRIN